MRRAAHQPSESAIAAVLWGDRQQRNDGAMALDGIATVKKEIEMGMPSVRIHHEPFESCPLRTVRELSTTSSPATVSRAPAACNVTMPGRHRHHACHRVGRPGRQPILGL